MLIIRPRWRAVLLAVTVAASGCGGGATRAGPGEVARRLTNDEATLLSEVLFRNFEAGGAEFNLAARRGPEGGTITIVGEIDWQHHRGHAVVTGGTSAHPVTEVWWDDETVAEYRPSLGVVVGPEAANQPQLLVRAPDKDHRRLDQLLAIVTGLAAAQPENSQLILQKEGSGFVRGDELRGSSVSVLRFGERSSYWIDVSLGTMLRLESFDSSGSYPVIVDLLSVGQRAVGIPTDAELVPFDEAASAEAALSTSP